MSLDNEKKSHREVGDTERRPHSEEYINEARLDWWRPGHLRSILGELNCTSIKTALDVGVGEGHWTALILGCFQESVKLVGIDVEEHWLKASTQFLKRALPQHSYEARRGGASSIPWPDDSFELVTCQTVLMHLSDPERALAEMVRVLQPGGLLLVAEPMNQLNRAAVAHGLASTEVDASSILWQIWRAFHEQRREAHQGDHNLAARLPTILQRQRDLQGIRAFHSDVVSFEGPTHQYLSILIDELKKAENRELMYAAGLSQDKIDAGIEALHMIIRDLDKRQEIIAVQNPNILFAARKIDKDGKWDEAHKNSGKQG